MSNTILLWAPRVAGLLLALFLGLFALDSFDNRSFLEGLPAFAVHLVPTYLVLAVVALAWRFQWIGALAFVALAAGYAVMVRFRMDWVLGISGPLLVVALLYLASWRGQAAHPAHP